METLIRSLRALGSPTHCTAGDMKLPFTVMGGACLSLLRHLDLLQIRRGTFEA